MIIKMTQKAEDTELARIFMTRDHMSQGDAAAKVEEMRSLVWEGEDPEGLLWEEGLELDLSRVMYLTSAAEDLLWEEGLEPDYIMDLI